MKRISIKATMSLVAILLLTAACTDELNDRPADTGRAIAFTPAAETRAAVEGSALPDDFKVWGWYGESTGNIDKNVFNGTIIKAPSWTYDGGAQYWIPGKTYNFYGVYPAGYGSCTNSGVITVEGFDCSEAVDLMTATATGLLGDDAPTVAMEFRHELARVKVSVESNGATVDELKVYGVGYKGNFSSGVPSKWTVTGTAEENTTPLLGETELDMLLLPTTDLTNAKLKVTYHYGNDASTRTDDASLAIAEGWTAGQQYHYKVSIVAGKLTIIVTVEDWNEEDTSVSWG